MNVDDPDWEYEEIILERVSLTYGTFFLYIVYSVINYNTIQ